MHNTQYTQTLYPHIYRVLRGVKVTDDFIANKSGYVQFDEIEQLGVNFVYDTIEECKKELDAYSEWLNNYPLNTNKYEPESTVCRADDQRDPPGKDYFYQ